MTIKNTDKNVSAENHEDVVVNASFNNGILTLIRKNLYDESTSAQKNIEVDLSDHKLKLKVITQARLNALKTSTDSDDIKERESYIFLVSFSADEEGVYREYIWIEDDEDFEVIGSTRVDLSNYVQKSNTNGLIKNNGTIDTNTYLTTHQDISGKANTSDLGEAAFSNDYEDLDNLPTIPLKTSDLTNDGADGTNVFVSNNDSRLSDARTPTSHTHTKSNITDFSHSHSSSNITDMAAVTVTITYTDNTTETLTLFKQVNNS